MLRKNDWNYGYKKIEEIIIPHKENILCDKIQIYKSKC